MMRDLLWIGLGGGLGSMARYLCQRLAMHWFPHAFPIGTFSVNIIGCLAIGIFWGMNLRSLNAATTHSSTWFLFLMAGLCGGFTTFSAFTLESIGLLRDQKFAWFLLYVTGSVLTGLLATFGGMQLAK